MKKLILLFLLLGFSIGGLQAQKFFAPVPDNLFSKDGTKALKGDNSWMLRPQVGVVGDIWYWNKELKKFEDQPFDWIGFGVGYEMYKPTSESDPTPYSVIGINGLVILGPEITGAVTIKALGIINAGVCYNFPMKKVGLLTGLQFRF